jgi:threonylcarbamoyladenosine tRNA methylthiotransferase MtaB
MNLSESEAIRGLLAAAPTATVVVNSCAVTAEAVRQSRRAVRRLRRDHPQARLLVTGCAATIDPATFAAMDEVDGVIENAAKLDPALAGARTARAGGGIRAPHPRVRGGAERLRPCLHLLHHSRRARRQPLVPIAQVLQTLAGHLAHGVAEVVLTGVDLTSWGADLPEPARLGDLVAAILRAFPALPRLRLSSVDGVEIDPLLLDLLCHEPRVMPHVHLSLQSGADMVLKRMKRRHTRAQALDLVDTLRRHRPDMAIGADLIAGFPTEDAAMHADNLSIVAAAGIVHGHVFPYSPRPGTPPRACRKCRPRWCANARRNCARPWRKPAPTGCTPGRPPCTSACRTRRHRPWPGFRALSPACRHRAGQPDHADTARIEEGMLA